MQLIFTAMKDVTSVSRQEFDGEYVESAEI